MKDAHSFVVISGNIAVGKSTLTHRLCDSLGWQPFLEAFAKNPYLEDFYNDMDQWSFHSQIYFLAQRLKHHHAIVNHPGVVVQDRSVYEDAEIFARNLFLQGNMSERDYATYRDLYDGIRYFLPPPDLVVFLHAPVGVLAERIAARGRDYERKIPIDYLQRINNLYDEWAAAWDICPMIRISSEEVDFVSSEAGLNAVVKQVQQALAV